MECRNCKLTLRLYLSEIYGNSEKLLGLLLSHGLMAREIKCAFCKTNIPIRKQVDNFVFRCSKTVNNKKCNFYQSARKGTFFSYSRQNIKDIVAFCIYWCQVPYPRQELIAFELGWTSCTIVDWSAYCREVCEAWAFRSSQKIGGPDTVVEFHDADYKKNLYYRGIYLEGRCLFLGIQKGDNSKFFLVPVDAKDKGTMLSVIHEFVLEGTTLVSNCWHAYDLTEKDYRAVNSIKLTTPENKSAFHNPGGNRQQYHWNTSMVPAFGRKREHFGSYLAENLFKKCYTQDERMHAFFEAASKLYPPFKT